MAKNNRELPPPQEPQEPEQPSPNEQQSRRRKRGAVIASLALTTPLILHGIYSGLPDFYPGNDPLPP